MSMVKNCTTCTIWNNQSSRPLDLLVFFFLFSFFLFHFLFLYQTVFFSLFLLLPVNIWFFLPFLFSHLEPFPSLPFTLPFPLNQKGIWTFTYHAICMKRIQWIFPPFHSLGVKFYFFKASYSPVQVSIPLPSLSSSVVTITWTWPCEPSLHFHQKTLTVFLYS